MDINFFEWMKRKQERLDEIGMAPMTAPQPMAPTGQQPMAQNPAAQQPTAAAPQMSGDQIKNMVKTVGPDATKQRLTQTGMDRNAAEMAVTTAEMQLEKEKQGGQV
jgi:hypothetical protein